MVELLGDSARGADWAAVRLRVESGRIVDADAAGIAEDLRGLTLSRTRSDRRSARAPIGRGWRSR